MKPLIVLCAAALLGLTFGLPLLVQAQAQAQAYPSKPVRILVGFSPGGVPDIAARILSQKLSESWKQSVLVENRLGAGSNIAAQAVAGAAPDAYTLLSVSSAHAIAPAIYPKLGFDAIKDFSGITLTATGPALLIVSPKLGVKSVAELIALAKSRPGQLNYASAGVGSGSHFAVELLKAQTGIDVVHVPFKGIPEALNAVIAGTVNYTITPMPNAIPQTASGKVNALGITVAKRQPQMSDTPTIAEAGLAGFRYDTWFGLLAPAATPRPIVDRLNAEVVRVLNLPEIRERFRTLGADPIPMGAREFDKFIAQQAQRFVEVAKQANIKAE